MAGGLNSLGNLLGKVNANGALVVALDGGVASATKFLAGDGTAAAPSYSFASATGQGWWNQGTGYTSYAQNGASKFSIGDNVVALGSGGILGWRSSTDSFSGTLDTSLSRGAANRLDLATGDSFNVVSGNITVGGYVQVGASDDFAFNGRSIISSPVNGQLVFVNNAETGASALGMGPLASATSSNKIIKKVTGIADAVATDVITVTVPNANHAAAIKVTFLASTGSTDAFESSRVAEGAVILARTAGVATVAAVATLELAQIATVAAGATLTLAYGASAMTGAASATQTFTIQVTLNDSGNVGSNQVVCMAELINAEATGITIA